MSKKNKPVTMAALQSQFQQAASLHQQGQLALAEAAYQAILAANPKHVDALHYLGILAAQTQRAAMGVELIERAIAINPHHHALYSNLGNSLMVLSRFEEAVKAYNKSLALKPGFEQALCNLGNAHKSLRQYPQAIAAFRKALAVQPRMPEAHANLGHTLSALGQDTDAVAHFQAAIALRPAFPEAYMGLAGSLHALRHHDDALAAIAQALALAPGNADAHEQRGNMLRDHGLLNESAASLQQALAIDPQRANAWNSLGVTHYELGRLPEAIGCYRRAIEADPRHLHAYTNLLFAQSISPDCPADQYKADCLRYQACLQSMVTPFTTWDVPAPTAENPLRIGFVSGDLCHHPVGFFIEGLLQHLDHARVQLLAYATSNKSDDVTARLKPHFAQWQAVYGMDAQAAAQRIRDDKVHVLIDLAGHTGDNMLEIFAWHPAPVQITWLGYFASTGIPGMGWLLADDACVPPGDEVHFTERIARLPHTRLCFTPPAAAPDVGPLPAEQAGVVTLGSFQPLAKLHDGVLQLWARVMAAVPNARLRLQNRALSKPEYRDALLARLQTMGIAADRVQLVEPTNHQAYLAAHAELDFILDSFPFNGGTTTCDALWMGVPTLTLDGQTMTSRQGAAIMRASGLGDWVARDADHFVQLAADKARDLPALADLRRQMRPQLLASPMFDAPRFAKDWLATVEQVWAHSPPNAHQPN